MRQLLLASSSPRRKEILSMLGIPFTQTDSGFQEILPAGIEAECAAEYFATQKALSAAKKIARNGEFPDILAADTAIALDGVFYGKPRDAEEAASFLRDFSGRTHAVYSAIALIEGNREPADGTDFPPFPVTARSRRADVTFKKLDEDEIAWYVSTGEWKGAAGGYRIQEKGACFIEHVAGAPGCVAGLPVIDVYELLARRGLT